MEVAPAIGVKRSLPNGAWDDVKVRGRLSQQRKLPASFRVGQGYLAAIGNGDAFDTLVGGAESAVAIEIVKDASGGVFGNLVRRFDEKAWEGQRGAGGESLGEKIAAGLYRIQKLLMSARLGDGNGSNVIFSSL